MSDRIKDNVSIFHDNDIYIDRRTILIIGEIDENMFTNVFKNLHVLDTHNKPISIVINSGGGDVTHGKAIYDAIKGCKSHVTALVYGEACSAASFILQAADNRYATPSSRIMIHVGNEALGEDHPRNLDAQYQTLRADEKWLEDVYLEKIKEINKKFTRRGIKTMLQYDKYLSPKEAKELNLIDDIRDSL